MTPMTSTTEIRTDLKDGILVVTMDGPKTRNSIGAPQYLALRAILMDAGNDPGVGAVVLTGANGFFSSGGNVNALKESRTLPLSEVSKNTDALSAMILALRGCPKPVIAAVNGLAVQGGLALAMLCDFMIASDTATFAELSARLGISPGWGLSQMLPRLIGLNRARQMSLTGEYIDADTARDWGLVNEVLPPHLLMARARELAGRIAEADPATTTRVRDLINESADHGLTASLRREGQVFGSHLNVGTLQQAARHRHQMLGRNRELNGTGSAS